MFDRHTVTSGVDALFQVTEKWGVGIALEIPSRGVRGRKPGFVTLGFALATVFLLVLTGCSKKTDPNLFQGYIEGEYVYVAAPLSGALTNLHVSRGGEVKRGDALFELERESESAARKQAADQVAQAAARLENLKKGKRPSELAAIEARLEQTGASLKLAESESRRVEKLYNDKVIAIDELDRARATRDLYVAQMAEVKAELATSQLGAREDEIKAATSEWEAAKASLAKADWSLAQKTQASPVDAFVHDTLYRQGEWVAAGSPVVSLLPPANVKVRFFVPQERVSTLKTGSAVTVNIDGVAQPVQAKVNYVSTKAEFTPPVIYSQQTRAKLVFMIEAGFDPALATGLHPGQPVDVQLAP